MRRRPRSRPWRAWRAQRWSSHSTRRGRRSGSIRSSAPRWASERRSGGQGEATKATRMARELAWEEAGSGRTMLFVHGFPFTRQVWYSQLQAVPPGWRGVAMDLRGFGESAPSDDPQYTMDMHADDAAALLTHLRV